MSAVLQHVSTEFGRPCHSTVLSQEAGNAMQLAPWPVAGDACLSSCCMHAIRYPVGHTPVYPALSSFARRCQGLHA